jgi:hypothetical protein
VKSIYFVLIIGLIIPQANIRSENCKNVELMNLEKIINAQDTKMAFFPIINIENSSKDAITEVAAPERGGCCSWHGGVCGCNYGRAVCCDGTYSPSCGCN